MAAKRQSLGKGLDALLGITEDVEEISQCPAQRLAIAMAKMSCAIYP